MKRILYYSFIALLFSACVGNDIEEDFVEPSFRVSTKSENPIPTLLPLDGSFTMNANFVNDVGVKTEIPIVWTSSNTEVITINNSGVVKAVGFGVAKILASVTDDNPSKEGEKITKEVATIEVVDFESGEIINKQEGLELVIDDTFDYDIFSIETLVSSWKSSDSSVVSVNEATGLVTAISEGTAIISVSTWVDGKEVKDSTEIRVVFGGVKASLSGSYGLRGTAILTSKELLFLDDFNVDQAPGGYFYLSNNPRSIAAAVRVGGQISARSGSWSIPLNNINVDDYKYIIFWCDPFNVYLGGGQFN